MLPQKQAACGRIRHATAPHRKVGVFGSPITERWVSRTVSLGHVEGAPAGRSIWLVAFGLAGMAAVLAAHLWRRRWRRRGSRRRRRRRLAPAHHQARRRPRARQIRVRKEILGGRGVGRLTQIDAEPQRRQRRRRRARPGLPARAPGACPPHRAETLHRGFAECS